MHEFSQDALPTGPQRNCTQETRGISKCRWRLWRRPACFFLPLSTLNLLNQNPILFEADGGRGVTGTSDSHAANHRAEQGFTRCFWLCSRVSAEAPKQNHMSKCLRQRATALHVFLPWGSCQSVSCSPLLHVRGPCKQISNNAMFKKESLTTQPSQLKAGLCS